MRHRGWIATVTTLVACALGWAIPLAAQHAPQRVSLAQFQKLKWLSGTWRGSGGDYAAFFEEYRVVNDSTIGMRAFSDSTLRVVTDSSVIEWRNGVVLKRSARSAYVAVQLTDSTVRFARDGIATGGFTWTQTAADRWTAVLHPASAGGRETVYVMRRIR